MNYFHLLLFFLAFLADMIFVNKGLASYCKAFHFSISTLSNASLGINNREIKSESGVSFAIASQPLGEKCFAFIDALLAPQSSFMREGGQVIT